MCNPCLMQWTETAENDLPKPVSISLEAFAADNFDVADFVDEHSQFQRLSDTLVSIKEWEDLFSQQLEEAVNSEFNKIYEYSKPVPESLTLLKEVSSGVNKFERNSARICEQQRKVYALVEKELEWHKSLCRTECEARKLDHVFTLLSELETVLPDLGSNTETIATDSCDDCVILAKSFVALVKTCQELKEVRAIKLLNISVEQLRNMLITKLNTAIASFSGCSKLRLLEAREYAIRA